MTAPVSVAARIRSSVAGGWAVRADALERCAVLVVCAVVAVVLNRRLLQADVFEGDALVHQHWMWHWRDPRLFDDPLTAALRESARYPLGYQALFWGGTQLTSPIVFGEWLGVALMACCGWLVFAIVREQVAWRPAAWIAAGLFLALEDIHRFSGGFSRAFVQPIVLATVLLALRDRRLSAALVAGGGALLYPPAAVLAVGVLVVSALGWRAGPAAAQRRAGRPSLHRRAGAAAALAAGIAVAAVVGTQLVLGPAPEVLTAAQARGLAELGPDGTLRFFASSTLEYLRQNRSGFDLRISGSMLVLAALALLLARPVNLRLLRGPVLAMPIVALGAYAAAQLVLFRLYLPHRYTYPLVAFAAIVVGVTLLPTWTALLARPRARLLAMATLCAPPVVAIVAVHAFPLAPMEPWSRLASGPAAAIAAAAIVLAAAAAVGLTWSPPAWAAAARGALAPSSPRRGARVGAALCGVTLLGLLVVVPDHPPHGWRCPGGPAVRFLAALPPEAIVAGDPIDLNCVPGTARRAVVVSAQLAPSYETAYLREGRARMFATLRAVYGPSLAAVTALRSRYGATHLWVRRGAIAAELRGAGRWRRRGEPYRSFVRRTVAAGAVPAALRLPTACRRLRDGRDEVYDLSCVAASTRSLARTASRKASQSVDQRASPASASASSSSALQSIAAGTHSAAPSSSSARVAASTPGAGPSNGA